MIERNNVVVSGSPQGRTVVFVHGFGCDQSMWRDVTPAFEADHRVVLYDLTGMGQSDLSAYDVARYDRLDAHAEDLLAILTEIDAHNAVVVGHSVGATIAVLAANEVLTKGTGRIGELILVSPSPCFYTDEEAGYAGGFARRDLEDLVKMLEDNHLGWSMQLAPTIAGQSADEVQADRLTQSFCRTDPGIAQHFGRVTFLGDHRADFEHLAAPSLVLHCDADALVPMTVAEWMRDRVPGTRVHVLNATGHCPHMTVPADVVAAMRDHLGEV
ncbi:alpha/beta fold hydrolase [Pseudooceanicola sp.]|uniref:alpha/beta fold hydrolase n=1 Tax=Pseudooceanicola sp. TaxID=1914328 RepID=UPI004057FC5B